MSALDRILPTPRKLELSSVELAIPPERAWEVVRHGDLGRSPLVRALFALRTLPDRVRGEAGPLRLTIDDLRSTPEAPGFRILVEDAPHEVVVGAIGKVWKPVIPFRHVESAAEHAAFAERGWVKVAWALRVLPSGEHGARVEFEVRVDATDDDAWTKFERYWLVVGPGSHFIRRSLLAALAREHGTPESTEEQRALAGDALLSDAGAQLTQSVTIRATPEAIWPWLVQMGCRRGGFYAIDALDNGGVPSAREIHPELQSLHVGQVIAASRDGDEGFEVLAIDAPRALVLGGLFDTGRRRQLPFAAARPSAYWHVTWAFVLEPLDPATTRVHVRARAAFSESEHAHARWIRPVHWVMEEAQLRHLAARVEGRLPRDSARDVLEGLGGAAVAAAAFLTPFARSARRHWGLDEASAARAWPGDALVASPRWSWTHGIEIDAPASDVWPWVAQIGADRGGFYSYQWLENVAGCAVRNAERVHPEWAVTEGGSLSLHPKMPPLRIALLVPGRHFVAHAGADAAARAAGRPWAETSWGFFVEPLGPSRTRFVSRFRCACSDDLVTRLELGEGTMEPIGFAMDRRMLLGVKARVEEAARRAPRVSLA